MDTKGKSGSGMNWETEIDIGTQLCIKQITDGIYCIAQGALLSALPWPKW